MRVFLSSLIFLVLVGCNSATDKVSVEETTVEVTSDSVPLAEEVDTIETKVEEEVNDFEGHNNLLELYEIIETARRHNDFSTIKKYVKADTFAFYYWPVKTEELDKIDFADLDSLLFDGGDCRGCGDYHRIDKHAKDFIVHKDNGKAHLDSNWRKNIIVTDYPHNPRNDSIMQLLSECNICDPQFDDDGAIHSFFHSNYTYSKKKTNNIIYIQTLNYGWTRDELLVFSEENGQYSLLGFHDFVEFQNEECNVYDPDKDSVVVSKDTIFIYKGDSLLKFKPNDCSIFDGIKSKYYQYGAYGKLKSEGNLKSGRKDGVWKNYNEVGTLINKETYADGTLIKTETF